MIKYSIEVWIYNPIIREMLLLKVKTDQFSFWQPITGGIENGEIPEVACIREIFEETGLKTTLTKLLKIGHHTVVMNEDLSIFKTLFLMETKRKDIRISDEFVRILNEWGLNQSESDTEELLTFIPEERYSDYLDFIKLFKMEDSNESREKFLSI